ncbi:4460_t:CDS:2 [Paraglomus occultum]|uniref:Palmitoyl-protein thioesterase 1 n=1 Tax=Paraglomus occultum TaxID=144539 RepID=A0A9N9BTH6_9GLOM|nr:4460_t:CDS:2 [Paraglomus occultum]
MGYIQELIKSSLPGVYVHSIKIGKDEEADKKAGFFGNANNEVADVCKKLKADENLQQGFNAIGFSQGGQFLRAYVERCNDPPVYNLVTFGSQHQGIADIPKCKDGDFLCTLMRSIAARGAYSGYVRERIIPAQYYKDPFRLELYKERSIFLPDINNELEEKNPLYKTNLASLNLFVMIKFTEETTVEPPESSWFGYYNEDGEILSLFDMPIYQEDWLGLRQLNETNRLVFLECEGKHMHLEEDYFSEIVKSYLSEPFGSYLTIQN